MYFKLTDNLLHSTLLPIVRTTLSQLLLNNFFFKNMLKKKVFFSTLLFLIVRTLLLAGKLKNTLFHGPCRFYLILIFHKYKFIFEHSEIYRYIPLE